MSTTATTKPSRRRQTYTLEEKCRFAARRFELYFEKLRPASINRIQWRALSIFQKIDTLVELGLNRVDTEIR